MAASAIREKLLSMGENPLEFISRLTIVDEQGVELFLNKPHDEQIVMAQDLLERNPDGTQKNRKVIYLTPRQIGKTTFVSAFNFAYGYWSLDPVRTLIVAHEADATDSVFRRLQLFHSKLPTMMIRPMARSNRKEMEFEDTGALWRCMTAGGRGHGRSWTYQRTYLDELAFWPNDEDVYASVTSTQHDGPHFSRIITSTGNGPGGTFHRLVDQCLHGGAEDTLFRFFRWADHAKYRRKPPDAWEPDQYEADLAMRNGIDIHQLYWRHMKVSEIGLDRFRREYPLTVEEAFMEFDGAFFDVEHLNEVLGSLHPTRESVELRIFEEPEPGMAYAIGADPSWGTGRDFAAAQVLSHDGRQVATMASPHWKPDEFAKRIAELSHWYNQARVMVEANTGGGGTVVIQKLMESGTPLWWGPRAEAWITSNQGRSRAGGWRGSKGPLLDHCRNLVDSDTLTLEDFATVRQLMHIKEDQYGRIEGQDGLHDDLAMALALACWCLRTTQSPLQAKGLPFKRRYKAISHPFGS